MVLKDGAPDELSPDTEQNVADQTDAVFRSFVCHMNAFDRSGQQLQMQTDDTPTDLNTEELNNASNNEYPFSAAGQIGRQLAIIGDAINERHAPQFNRMIRLMNLTPDTAYEAFAGVARKLFRRDGNISWGRVITLLCFGYRMAISVLQRRIRGFFSNIVSFVARFILTESIAKWIADQGGWRAVLSYIPEQIGWSTVGLIVTMAALTVLTVICLTARRQQ